MRIGVVLPTFAASADSALDTARRAEAAGLDGVFVYDHLFPIGGPDRPALHSLTILGAIAAVTSSVTIGPLVARISLLRPDHLVEVFETLHLISGGRVVAALGLGDKASEAENVAYGLAVGTVAERAAALVEVCDALRERGVPSWVGGRSSAAVEAARGHACGWNLWDANVADFASPPRSDLVLSWAGPCLVAPTPDGVAAKRVERPTLPGPTGTAAEIAAHAQALADAGVAWAIYAPPDIGTDATVMETLADVASRIR